MFFLNGSFQVVLVYNSLGWKREDVIRIPVSNNIVIITSCAYDYMISTCLLLCYMHMLQTFGDDQDACSISFSMFISFTAFARN